MKLFQCQSCDQFLHFENSVCLRCGAQVGYQPEYDRMVAVEPDGAFWQLAPDPSGLRGPGRWRFCRNWEYSVCNWMVKLPPPAELMADRVADEPGFCLACQHNRTVPDLCAPENLERWQKIEIAKRRLIYALLHLDLPRPDAGSPHPQPMLFDFLADMPGAGQRVLTGHREGVITISLLEADDAAREQMRADMAEAYRTLLGHFRHEVGHYYWDILVRDGGHLDSFRALFGDERASYKAAMELHYQMGAPLDWQENHVSAYATMHPWEDWAETWAHYLHILDALETAAAFGISIDPGVDDEGELAAEVNFNPWRVRRARRLVGAWTPLTVALNAMNRSMGQGDLYPFVLAEPVVEKITYVHDLVRGIARAH